MEQKLSQELHTNTGNNGISEMKGNNNYNNAKIKGSIDKVLQ